MCKNCLAIMRLQPMHEGHKILINQMFNECKNITIAIGSVNKNDKKNPFSYEKRKQMVLDAFGNRENLFIIPLTDIGAKSKAQWIEHVLDTLRTYHLSKPDCYFSGSYDDASWYDESGWDIKIVDRFTIGKGINATQIRKDMGL